MYLEIWAEIYISVLLHYESNHVVFDDTTSGNCQGIQPIIGYNYGPEERQEWRRP